MKSKSAPLNLLLEIFDDGFKQKVRCLHCYVIISNKNDGFICQPCYDKLTPPQLVDMEFDD